MAIEFARLEYVSRSSGGNSCRKASYNGRQKIRCERDGNTYDFSHEGDNSHHEILIPKGVSEKFVKAETLWNAVEASEKRINSQLAKELVLALPDDPQIQLEDRILLAKTFIQKHFVSKGLAAQLDVHHPHRGKDHNWHAHVLITTRRFTPDGLEIGEKARDLDAEVRKGKVVEGSRWGKLWAEHQNSYFAEKGIELQVDPTGIVPQEHLGPVRMRARAFALLNEHARIETSNEELSVKPDEILKKLTERQSFFTEGEFEQFLKKHVPTDSVSSTRKVFWEHPSLLQLLDPNSGERLDQFTSTQVREEENRILRIADRIYRQKPLKVNRSIREETLTKVQLNDQQRAAFETVMIGKGLSCIEGRAGTGKSYLIGALSSAYQAAGHQVRGLAPTSEVAQDLTKLGLSNSQNIHRFLYRNKHGRELVNHREVWIIDEAAMIGNSAYSELFKLAWKKGCQVVLVGDSRQLPSVERGGMFEVFCQKFSASELSEIRRQELQEDRVIAESTAKGGISYAIDQLQQRGQLHWTLTKQEAIEQLITKWNADRLIQPGQTSIILEHRNDYARVMNDTIHSHLLEKGGVGPEEFQCETFLGTAFISCGDRIQFRKNDSELNVINGQLGSIVALDENRVSVRLDAGGERVFNPRHFHHFQLGYAGTIHRSQGKTVDRAYALHSPWMNRNLFYVATTRHRKSLDYFIPKEECSSLAHLKFQSQREGGKIATVSWNVGQKALDPTSELETSIWKRAISRIGDYLHRDEDFYQKRGRADSNSGPYSFVKVGPHAEIQEKKSHRSIKNKTTAREEHSELLRAYLDAEAIVKHTTAIKKESAQRGISHSSEIFQRWKDSLNQRDELAHRLTEKMTNSELGKQFDSQGLQILQKQAASYARKLERMAEQIEQGQMREATVYLQNHVEELCYRLFPEGPTSKSGNTWRFRVNHSLAIPIRGEKVGTFYDFVEGRGGALLTLVQQELNLDPKNACKWALELPQTSSTPSAKIAHEHPEEKWISLKPTGEAPTLFGKKGFLSSFQEVARYSYRDRAGELLYYVVRMESIDGQGRKITPPLSFGYYPGKADQPFWRFKAFQQEKKSLYNLHLLERSPDAEILIVEGEKTADAAALLFPKHIVVTWPGGAGAVAKADWAVLQDRRVAIWPDHDEAGYRASKSIAEELRKVGVKSLRAVTDKQLSSFPEKWDLADDIPGGKNALQLNRLLQEGEKLDRGPIALFEKLYPKEMQTITLREEFLYRVAFLEKIKRARYVEANGFDDPISRAYQEYQNQKTYVGTYLKKNFGLKGELLEAASSVSSAFLAQKGRLPEMNEVEQIVVLARSRAGLEDPTSKDSTLLAKRFYHVIEEKYFSFHANEAQKEERGYKPLPFSNSVIDARSIQHQKNPHLLLEGGSISSYER